MLLAPITLPNIMQLENDRMTFKLQIQHFFHHSYRKEQLIKQTLWVKC